MLLTHVRSVCVLLLSLVFSVVGSGSVNGQDRSSSDDGSVQAEAAVTEDTDGQDSGGFKVYEEVITDNASSDDGVFTVHRLDGKVFYEIPTRELGREFLWVSQIERTTVGVGYGGQSLGNRIVKWDRTFGP